MINSLDKYTVVVVKFPFASSLKYKARPAVIISNEYYNQHSNLSSTEYHIHKSLKIGKIFKIKFVGLAVANSRILFRKDCLFLGFPMGFMRFPICLDRFF